MKYTFRPIHIALLLISLIVLYYLIWAWTTGWECGFLSYCPLDSGRGIKYFFQSLIRIFSTMLGILFLFWFLITSDYEKEITIPNPFKEKIDPEAQELFQEWLRERKDKP